MESILNIKVLEGITIELSKFRELLEEHVKSTAVKSHKLFYNNNEVKEMFGINDGTLSTWRAQGILKGKKVRGTWFYKAEEVMKIVD